MLNEVDKPGSDIDDYIMSLEKMLAEKLKSIHGLQNRIAEFKSNLDEERVVNEKIQNKRRNSSFEVMDLAQDDDLEFN